ncbi:MAG: hypothetical protein LBH98_00640 [Chitinispirillales bacterium]|nr:hypothetical protein [Chitinispirillales bacterium]
MQTKQVLKLRNSILRTLETSEISIGRLMVNGSNLIIVEAKDSRGKTYKYSAKFGVKR